MFFCVVFLNAANFYFSLSWLNKTILSKHKTTDTTIKAKVAETVVWQDIKNETGNSLGANVKRAKNETYNRTNVPKANGWLACSLW